MKKVLIIFTLTSLLLTAVWFRGGSLLGGGEVGTQFYNLKQMVNISAWAWGAQIFGGSSGLTVAGAPFYLFFNFFQQMQIPGFILQASLFVAIVFLTLFSMFKLSEEFFPKISVKAHIAASVFYFVNSYALVNIWNRFLQNSMIFYAFLPLGVYLFLKGLRTKNYVFPVLAMVITSVLSYGFAGPSQTIIFWFVLFAFGVYYAIFIKKERFVIGYFLISLVSWFLFNFFWVFQELSFRFSASYASASTFFTSAGNLETFNALSRVLGKISSLLLLRHEMFFTQSIDLPSKWPLFYSNFITLSIQWGVTITVLIFSIKKRKDIWVRFLLFLFFIGIFLSKGNAPPLGDILNFLFRKISYLEFFRNPLEKIGLILPLSFAPLFGLAIDSLDKLAKEMKSVKRFLITNTVWIYLIVFLGFPFWTGMVFTSGNPPANNLDVGYRVNPPGYYKEADNYLSSQPGTFRFMTFPLAGEGIFNNWGIGYAGVEQSGVLFTTPSISFNTTIPYYHHIVNKLENFFINNTNFYEIARLMTVKYLMYRTDFDFKLSGMRNPETIEQILNSRLATEDSMLTHAADFGALKFYKYDDSTFLPKIFASDILILNNDPSYIDDVLWGPKLKQPAIYTYTDVDISNTDKMVDLTEDASLIAVHNDSFFDIANPFPQRQDDMYIFPHVSILPDSKAYPFVLLKENLIKSTYFNLESRTNWELMMLGKRLKEAKILTDKGDIVRAKKSIALYEKKLSSFLENLNSLTITAKLPSEDIWHEGEVFRAFSAHMYLFEELEKTSLNKDGSITESKKSLYKRLSDSFVLPIFKVNTQDDFILNDRVVYQFNIGISGEYEILIPKTKSFPSKFDIGYLTRIQVDNSLVETKITDKGKYVSFGTHLFDKGNHNIGINQGKRSNLVGNQDFVSFDINTGKETKEIQIPIDGFDPFESYSVEFDYRIIAGSGFNFYIQQNVDKLKTIKNQQPSYFSPADLVTNGYWHDWVTYQTRFIPQAYSDEASLKITVKPWNNCEEVFKRLKWKCEDKSVRDLYGLPTQISVKNLKVTPNIPQKMVLLSQRDSKILPTPSEVSFEKINTTKYLVHVKGADEPFILVFSELFNTGWQISSFNHFLINGYANGWLIDKTGDYDLTIEYSQQKFLKIGYITSIISVGIGLIFCVYKTMSKNYDN